MCEPRTPEKMDESSAERRQRKDMPDKSVGSSDKHLLVAPMLTQASSRQRGDDDSAITHNGTNYQNMRTVVSHNLCIR